MDATPYADVNEFVGALWQQQRRLLGDNLVGGYLGGSLALGDFDPAASDLDLLVVTAHALGAPALQQLHDLHERIAASGDRWASRLEVSYIPQASVRRYDPGDCHHPSIGETWPFGVCLHDEAWVIQRWIIRNHGVTVQGPPPATLIDPVSEQDLRAAVLSLLREDWSARLDNPEWFRPRHLQAYGVLTMCRCQYTIVTGAVASKPVAAAWAKQALPQWAHLIDQALGWRYDTDPGDVTETMAFIRAIVERNV